MQGAFQNIIDTVMEGDTSLFDFQMKTNERLYRIQNQVSNNKKEIKQK